MFNINDILIDDMNSPISFGGSSSSSSSSSDDNSYDYRGANNQEQFAQRGDTVGGTTSGIIGYHPGPKVTGVQAAKTLLTLGAVGVACTAGFKACIAAGLAAGASKL